jgi:hypothetical protein
MKKKGFPKKYLFISVIVILVLIIFIAFYINNYQSDENTEILSHFRTPLIEDRSNESKDNEEGSDLAEIKEGKLLNVSSGSARIPSSARSVSSIGVLRIINAIHYNYTSGTLRIIHRDGALEEKDGFDSNYYPMFTPEGVASKIVSLVGVDELEIDSRPLNSISSFNITLSLISSSGNPITISESTNFLRFSFPRADMGYVFDGKQLYLTQYNISNLSQSFPSHNIKDYIHNNQNIELPNLSGVYDSEVPYAYFRIDVV